MSDSAVQEVKKSYNVHDDDLAFAMGCGQCKHIEQQKAILKSIEHEGDSNVVSYKTWKSILLVIG